MLHDLLHTLPLGIPALLGCAVLLIDAFSDPEEGDSRYLGVLSALGFATGLVVCYLMWGRDDWVGFETATFGAMMVLGRFELAACAILMLIGGCVSLMCVDYAPEHGFDHGELYALVNFAVFGMMVLVCATNVVTLFVGLEIMSISVYILAAIKRTSPFSAEAGMKYFVLGAFASGFLLMGLAYVYGETVSFEYGRILAALYAGGEPSAYVAVALFLIVAAFGFKIALVPFHMWTPDVYEGAPPPVTALMATGVKTAAIIAMARLFVMAFPSSVLGWIGTDLFDTLAILAVITMTVGNVVALHQTNVKRMLGYSSIAHAGYLLIGVLAAHAAAGPGQEAWGQALSAVLFYLFVYALANLGAFAVIGALGKDGEEDITLDRVSGLATAHPVAALVLGVAMLSLAGIPPTGGFFGKLALFREALAVDSDRFLWLVIAAVLNSVISVYYYLRVVVHAYMHTARAPIRLIRGTALALAFAITTLGSIQVGIFPGRYMVATDEAAETFIPLAWHPESEPAVDIAALQPPVER